MIRRVSELPYSSVTPKSVYLDRRVSSHLWFSARRQRCNREYKAQCSKESLEHGGKTDSL